MLRPLYQRFPIPIHLPKAGTWRILERFRQLHQDQDNPKYTEGDKAKKWNY